MIYVRANNSGIKVTNTLIIINHNMAPHTHVVCVQRGGATAWAAVLANRMLDRKKDK